MSTKIYDAYKYSGTPEELMKWLIKFKKKYEDLAVEELRPLFINQSKYLEKHPKVEEPYCLFKDPLNYFSTSRGVELIIRKKLNEPLNIDTSVVVYFHNGLTVVQFFGLDFGFRVYSKKLKEGIIRSKKFIDFSYWNNTDRPDDVSDKEWDERRKFYDSLTEKYHFFNSIGLVYELSNTESILDICRRISERIREDIEIVVKKDNAGNT